MGSFNCSQFFEIYVEINGLDEDLYGDIVPIEVITSLGASWHFGPGHQDAHELLHVILSALQTENQIGSIRVNLFPIIIIIFLLNFT